MTAAPEVDWAAVDRRARRREPLLVLPVAGWFVALVALSGGFFLWHGAGAWWAVAGYLVVLGVILVLRRVVPRLRRTAGVARRIQFALRHRVDPGPEARERTDVLARRQAALGWTTWSWPFFLAGLLTSGRWDRPAVAVPAAVVLLGLSGAGLLVVRRQVRDARRWVADPPGPARDVPPPNALERWTNGRRLVLAVVALALVGALGGVLISVLD